MLQILTLTLSLLNTAPSSPHPSKPPTTATASEACASDDLSCIKRKLAEQILEAESLGRQLALALEQTRTADQMMQVWKDQAARWKEAGEAAMASLKPSPWYREPVLWFAVGAVTLAAITVAIVYAIAPAFSLAK